jgi:hypothetical protein
MRGSNSAILGVHPGCQNAVVDILVPALSDPPPSGAVVLLLGTPKLSQDLIAHNFQERLAFSIILGQLHKFSCKVCQSTLLVTRLL